MAETFQGTGLLTSNARRERSQQIGSPAFRFRNAEILTTKKEIMDFETKAPEGQTAGVVRKYLPIDSIEIQNINSTNDIAIWFNQDPGNQEQVARSSSKVIEPPSSGISSILIENLGSGTIAADEVTIIIKRRPMDADKRALIETQKGFGLNAYVQLLTAR